jgi:protein-L-isoaspartate O-methyltransferase
VDHTTVYRDAWADSKQATVAQVLLAAKAVVQEIRRGGLEIDGLMQRMTQSVSFRDFYASVERLAEISRSVSYNVHNLKLLCDMQVAPITLYTDHFLNQFFLMSALKRTWFVEGPAFCGLAIEPGCRMLEIGCGTGYYTDIFFSPLASEIVAIDIDHRAIETACRMHQTKNIRYEVMDARKELPAGRFDVVLWTPSIFAFTPHEFDALVERLRNIMSDGARLVGWTYVEVDHDGQRILWYDMKSLANRFKRHFKNVRAFERVHSTIQPPRHSLFFYASDGSLPFDAEWLHGVRL